MQCDHSSKCCQQTKHMHHEMLWPLQPFLHQSPWREKQSHMYAIQWLASQRDTQITHAIILTDSINLQKVESGMGCTDWHTAMHSLWLQRLLWIYCPGHTRVSGNEWADRLASAADFTSGLQLGRAEVLRGLRNFLNTDRPEHQSTDRLKERGVEKGSGRHSSLQGQEQSVFNQTLALFQGQPCGDCWEMEWSMYGPFQALQCHLELKPKPKLKPSVRFKTTRQRLLT